MLNVLLAGVGGQGTVLAAKVLAQAAQEKGWNVRTAETIGMAQRGGNVTSHVRMGNLGEQVHAPLLSKGTADLIIAFEPGEAARSLEFLSPTGTLVTATTAIQPVTAALSKQPYRATDVLERLESSMLKPMDESAGQTLIAVDDQAITDRAGTRRVLNMVLLASALQTNCIPLTLDDLKTAVRVCVKPQFIDMNLQAMDTAVG